MVRGERYHHGDLRNALMTSALSIVAESGLDGLGLRAVAARAGVSHAAPAHHFPTLKHLTTALAAIAFERFQTTLQEDIDGAPRSARGGLAGACDGYVRFARENPQLFRLMFSPSRLDWTDPVLQAASDAAHRQLARVCAAVAEARGESGPDAQRRLEVLVWSSVHGYAHLLLTGQLARSLHPTEVSSRPNLEDLLLAAS